MLATLPPSPVVIHVKPAEPRVKIVRVKPGETLSGIARHYYGKADRWPALFWANRHKIGNPEMLRIGMRLFLGTFHPLTRWQHAKALSAIPALKPVKPVVTVAAQPVTAPASVPSSAPGGFEGCVIQAESGGDPTAINQSSGASGLFGFLLSTWDSLGLGYPGGAYTAPASVQMQGFQILFARDGTAPWAPFDGC